MARKKPVTWAALYLIQFGEFVKVGISNDPTARLRTIQSGLPAEATMPYYAVLPKREMAVDLEKRVHQKLQDRRARGEWFRVSVDEAVAVVDDLCRWGKPILRMPAEEFTGLARSPDLTKRLRALSLAA